MKDDEDKQQHPHQLIIFSRRITTMMMMISNKKLARPIFYLILLILSYAFGYYSNYSNHINKPKPSSTLIDTSTIRNNPTITTTTATAKPAGAATDSDHFRFLTRCAEPIPSKLVRRTILDRVYNGTSPFKEFPPPHINSLLRQKRIKGWGSKGAVFENLIRRVKPRIIIEVGTFLGASAIHMAELTRELGLRTQILCVDDFRGWPGFRDRFKDIQMVNGDLMLMYQFMQNVVHSNVSDSVLPIPFSTGSALEKLCEWGVFGDLVEVDAGHDFHSAWSDINRAYKILRPGGVMFGHDYFTSADERGVRRAVNLFARVKGLRVQVDGQHWVMIDPV